MNGLPDLPSGGLRNVAGLYVHVPFCFHKCHYCDFYSITRQTPQGMARFVELLLREAEMWGRSAADRSSDEAMKGRIHTVFIGGGTPSLLPMDQMARLLGGLRRQFDLCGVNEWTVECNPATVSPEYCAMLRENGVDRLSFGAQSFIPSELSTLERLHEPADVTRTVRIARAAGFRRINVDLIYAIPGQSMESWSDSLRQAIDLGTEHISCYNLTYEPNTPIAVKRRVGQIAAVEESAELAMLHRARRVLADAGYAAYEISNYARPAEECRHNLLYWRGGNYIGLGPSAASHVDGRRWRNRAHLGEWESAVEKNELPVTDFEELAPGQRLGELVMLQLRLAEGVRTDVCLARVGLNPIEIYAGLIDRLIGLELLRRTAHGFALREKGLNVADAVAAEFLG